MTDYVVYKITCITDENIFYIGSTNDLKKRIFSHRACYKRKNHRHIYQCMDKNGGFDNFEFTIIETLNNTTKREAERREQHFITTLNPVMNDMKRCYMTPEDKKEKIAKDGKEYYKKNRDRISEEGRNYREKNKERISNYSKEYYEKNKERIIQHQNVVIICECGCLSAKANLPRHKRSQKHIRLMNELT
jgi:group I intron endonuclease